MPTTRWWWVRHAPIAPPHDQGFAPRDAVADLSDQASIDRTAAGLPDDAIWLSSPAVRTRTTVEALRRAMGVSAVECDQRPELVEQDFGDWHGRTYEDVYAELDPASLIAPALTRPPRGETFADVMARLSPVVDSLSERHGERDIVAVAHAGTIRAAIGKALGLAPDGAIRFVVDLLSVTRLDRIVTKDGKVAWRVGAANTGSPKVGGSGSRSDDR